MSLFTDDYARRALVEALLVGALCGTVGVHVVLRRLSFFTMAMTHATFPGVVLAAIVGVDLLLGSGLFGVLVVLGVTWLSARPRSDSSAAVGVVLSAGFALGVVLLSAQAGFTRDLSAYLVGSILTVQDADLVKTAVVLVVVVAVLAAVGKELVFGAFDRVGLVALGYPVRTLDLLLLLLIEVTVVTSVPAVGTILAVALVVAPAATARLWCDRVLPMTLVAAGVGMAAGTVGLALSQLVDVAAGAAIVLTACAFFVLSVLAAPVLRRSAGGPARESAPAASVPPRSTGGLAGESVAAAPVPPRSTGGPAGKYVAEQVPAPTPRAPGASDGS